MSKSSESERLDSDKKGGLKFIRDLLEKEMQDIASKNEMIKKREQELEKREALVLKERQELVEQKQMIEKATAKVKMETEPVIARAEEYMRMNSDLEKKYLSIQTQFKDKEEKLVALEDELKEKEEEMETMNALNQTLTAKERDANDQLQEVRQEIIQCLEKHPGVIGVVGVKRMGDIDELAFQDAVRSKLPRKGIREKAAELSSFWQDKLRDPKWHPFKTVPVEGTDDHHQAVFDLEDDNVKILELHLGKEARDIVISVLKEMNEYNPSGRFPVPELWNFEDNRKASLKEGVVHMDLQRKRFIRCSSSSSGLNVYRRRGSNRGSGEDKKG